MSTVSSAFSKYVPVTSRPNNTPDRIAQAPDPDVGARWGRPASYIAAPSSLLQTGTGGVDPTHPWVDVHESDTPLRKTKILNAVVIFSWRTVAITSESGAPHDPGGSGQDVGGGGAGGPKIPFEVEPTQLSNNPGAGENAAGDLQTYQGTQPV